jgi:hypothetical protein
VDAMDCDILLHGDHSSDNGSTENDIYKHPHGDHGRGKKNHLRQKFKSIKNM